jgi:hypothetical protein
VLLKVEYEASLIKKTSHHDGQFQKVNKMQLWLDEIFEWCEHIICHWFGVLIDKNSS